MQKKTVFLLQDTKEMNDMLEQLFIQDGEFQVEGSSTDGISAISVIAEKKPRFVLTALVVSGYDGMSVISKVRSLGLNVMIIV